MTKKEKVRAELVLAARKAFTSHGYAQTTMDDIARAAGKAKSTLYYYFESKEDAFRAVIDLEGETLKKLLLKIIRDPNRTALQKVRDYVLTRWQEFEKLGNFYRTMRREFIENYDFVQKYRRKFDEIEIQFISMILKQGVESKEFIIITDDIDMVASAIFLSMKALEIPFFAKKNSGNIKSKLNTLLNMLFYGITGTENNHENSLI